MTELLAPAGDLNCFYAAVNHGADAVYLGLKNFSARSSAGNFSIDELKQATDYAALFGVKVYVTVNTVIKEEELFEVLKAVLSAYLAGADGFIVQDFYFGKMLKEVFPFLELHLSTQAGVCNTFFAKAAKNAGYSRVVLSRELPLSDIEAISQKAETEAFIQGAMCTAFSGHCYFSSFVGGNSGNRGRCKQPCRKKYTFITGGVPAEPAYAISLSDLFAGETGISALKNAGVTSFKIEGRMRREEYVAAATDYYRALLDGKPGDPEPIYKTYNRGDYSKGYWFGQDKNLISDKVQSHKGVKIGVVAEVRGKTALVRSRYFGKKGDGFKILCDGKETGGAVFLASAPEKGGFTVSFGGKVSPGDSVHLTTDAGLKARLAERKRLLPVELTVKITKDGATLTLLSGETEVSSESKDVFPAENAPLDKAGVSEQMQKTAGLPVEITLLRVRVGAGLFMTKAALNAMRREAYDKLFAALRAKKRGERAEFVLEDMASAGLSLLSEIRGEVCGKSSYAGENPAETTGTARAATDSRTGAITASALTTGDITGFVQANKTERQKRRAVVSDTFDFPLEAYNDLIFAPNDYHNQAEIDAFFRQTEGFAGDKYLFLPAYFTDGDAEVVYPYVKRFHGVFSEGGYGAEFAARLKLPLFAGEENNATNTVDIAGLKAAGAEKICLSKELSMGEIENIMDGSAYALCMGSVRLMLLCYCPFRQRCKTCKITGAFFMKDEEGRTFPVRRYRLNGCRFEIYNNLPLSYQRGNWNELYSFLAVPAEERKKISVMLLSGGEKQVFSSAFSGHFRRGVE